MSFDSTYLNASGTGSISTASYGFDPGITWSFTDGHNLFNSTITTSNFAIQMSFTNFAASTWNIDTTFGVTSGADIFALNGSRYESYYQGGFATSATKLTSANWVLTQVPETASVSVLGLSFGFLGLAGFLFRRRVR
ncbi:MAG: hypothetical protein NTV51_25895 [Verrucomicrobia bacterium]|nr:hypothetical protein [Verrucomicrobiota bacterium]